MTARKLIVRPLGDFLAHGYPPVEYVIKPWLPKRGIAMVSAWRGTGKTYFALGLAYAIATGGTFLDFTVPEPRKVLYVDGEMDPADTQQRLQAFHQAATKDGNGDPSLAPTNLRVLSHSDQPRGIPDLADFDDEGRQKIIEAMDDADVLILDNLSALCHSGVENDAESWVVMQDWLIDLRRKNKTTVLVHHTGKPRGRSGRADQRGTSKREDVLNTSIRLRPVESGQFGVEFTKTRGFKAPDDFTVAIKHDEKAGYCRLVRKDGLEDRVAMMKSLGMPQKDIAQTLGTSEPTVSRILARRRELEIAAAEGSA